MEHLFPLQGNLAKTPFKAHLLVSSNDSEPHVGTFGPIGRVRVVLNSPRYGVSEEQMLFSQLPENWQSSVILKLEGMLMRVVSSRSLQDEALLETLDLKALISFCKKQSWKNAAIKPMEPEDEYDDPGMDPARLAQIVALDGVEE